MKIYLKQVFSLAFFVHLTVFPLCNTEFLLKYLKKGTPQYKCHFSLKKPFKHNV
jgi:hypothetical protein